MDAIAYIPARAGSKSIKSKNLARIGTQTLLGRCIETCRKAVSSVLVSSDSECILAHAAGCGAGTIQRPRILAADKTHTVEVLRHAVRQFYSPIVCLVQCTAPFLSSTDITNCISLIRDNPDVDLAWCVHKFHGVVFDDNGASLTYRDLGRSVSRHDQSQQWVSAGSCWAMRAEYLRHQWASGKIGFVEAEFDFHFEIDSALDLALARAIDRHFTIRGQ